MGVQILDKYGMQSQQELLTNEMWGTRGKEKSGMVPRFGSDCLTLLFSQLEGKALHQPKMALALS